MTIDIQKYLSDEDYKKASEIIELEIPMIKAVAKIECFNKPFTESGKPNILFEGHVFWKELSNRNILNKTLNTYKDIDDILYTKINRSKYKSGDEEWKRLEKARKINEDAALCSTSFGMFQIMGFNYENCNCTSVLEFELQNSISCQEQLKLFCIYMLNTGLTRYLQNKQFDKFARYYNGTGYKKNKYDILLEKYYNEYKNIK